MRRWLWRGSEWNVETATWPLLYEFHLNHMLSWNFAKVTESIWDPMNWIQPSSSAHLYAWPISQSFQECGHHISGTGLSDGKSCNQELHWSAYSLAWAYSLLFLSYYVYRLCSNRAGPCRILISDTSIWMTKRIQARKKTYSSSVASSFLLRLLPLFFRRLMQRSLEYPS